MSAGWHAVDIGGTGGSQMVLFLLFVIVAIALGILGVVLKGLFYLLIIGIIVFLADLIFLGFRMGRNRARPSR